jgi:hypothetical protein
MTAPSLELWRPSFALRKAQLRLLAYGFLLRRPCPLFQNEGYLSFRGELRFPLTCRLLCRTCDCSTSYANRPSFVLPSHPPMFASTAPLPATRVYDATTTISVARDHPLHAAAITRALFAAELLCRKTQSRAQLRQAQGCSTKLQNDIWQQIEMRPSRSKMRIRIMQLPSRAATINSNSFRRRSISLPSAPAPTS